MKRKIIKIDEDKCNGCGNCVNICAEAALQIVAGKAKLVKDFYCDGMGACLDVCPVEALTIVEEGVAEYNPEKTFEHVKKVRGKDAAKHVHGVVVEKQQVCACPGSAIRDFGPAEADGTNVSLKSQLRQWPVQLHLLGPGAPYFDNADLLLCADCVPFANPNFYQDVLKGKVIAIGCPKLDDNEAYIERLVEILKSHSIKSITVNIMEVPCCRGLLFVAEEAIKKSRKKIPLHKIITNIR